MSFVTSFAVDLAAIASFEVNGATGGTRSPLSLIVCICGTVSDAAMASTALALVATPESGHDSSTTTLVVGS